MDKEYEQMMTMDAWKLVPPTPGEKPLHMLWVFREKDNGTAKAPLVVNGSAQFVGRDLL
jgi:hypothetical protein